MKLKTSTLILMAITLGIGTALTARSQTGEKPKKELLRVGVYDSRAIAVTYYQSEHWNKILKAKLQEMEEAKARGDEKKVKELEAWGSGNQQKAHLQGFGTAPVHSCLDVIRDKLPDIVRQAGVDVIVSKWEFDYQSPEADVVDITDPMVAAYNPSQRVLDIVKEMKDKAPLSEEEILAHPD